MTVCSERDTERREAVTVVQAEMMVAWPTMVGWKWWDRKFQDKLGSGGQGKRIKAVWHGQFISCAVLGKSLTFSEPEDWLGHGGRFWVETEDVAEISPGDSEGKMGDDACVCGVQ